MDDKSDCTSSKVVSSYSVRSRLRFTDRTVSHRDLVRFLDTMTCCGNGKDLFAGAQRLHVSRIVVQISDEETFSQAGLYFETAMMKSPFLARVVPNSACRGVHRTCLPHFRTARLGQPRLINLDKKVAFHA